MWQYNYSPELYHYGVMGMRWGHRKQRPVSMVRTFGQGITNLKNADKKRMLSNSKSTAKAAGKIISRKIKENNPWNKLSDKQKKAVKIGAAVAGAALLTYGSYKLSKNMANKYENKVSAALNKSFSIKDPNSTDPLGRPLKPYTGYLGSKKGQLVKYNDKRTGQNVEKFIMGNKRDASKYIKRNKTPGTYSSTTKGRNVVYRTMTFGKYGNDDWWSPIHESNNSKFYAEKAIRKAARGGYRLT